MSRGSRRQRRRARQRAVVLGLLVVALAGATASLFVRSSTPTTASTTSTSSTTTTTTTTVPKIAATLGWGVIARTGRGVAVDQRWVTVSGGARVYVLRFRKGATAFHFHVGSEDPPGADAAVPGDVRSAISAPEWRVGVLGVFNGGFKHAAKAGGVAVDGYVAASLKAGSPTVVIDAKGQLTIGTWGVDVPARGDPVIAARQNLGYLVLDGSPTPTVGDVAAWGVTLGGVNAVARTGIGVDAAGDVLFAVGSPILPTQLADALVAAGAVRAMQLDINPFWPISGAARTPLHAPAPFAFAGPYSEHDPSIYATGWLRDFFVVLAEPSPASCAVRSPYPVPGRVMPEPPVAVCGPGG